MRIVVLDSDPAFGSSRSPSSQSGALDYSLLKKLGSLQVYAQTTPEQLLNHAHDAEIVLSNKVLLGSNDFKKLPRLRMISVLATGVNSVDLTAAQLAGITVCNVPGYSTASTAQHALALLLELTNRVGLHERDVESGGWEGSPTFSYFKTPLLELEGLTLGIVGLGAIGTRMATICRALGMKVLATTRTKKDLDWVEFVDKEELLARADVVSLHCPLTEKTKHFIDAEALLLMKPTALLLNVARGPLVNEAELAKALRDGKIAGAATDVLASEPPGQNHVLVHSTQCIVTPHIAWATLQARRRLLRRSIENIVAYQEGSPQNVVGKP